MKPVSISHRIAIQLQALHQMHGKVNRYWVAYSGGMDSHVLLHLLTGMNANLYGGALNAVHIHHGLSGNADSWVKHCRRVCEQLQINLITINVNANAARGDSPEEKARQARYDAFHSIVKSGDCLLTAHHEDDQAETVLLQLLRGAGPKGLAAMPVSTEFGMGIHCRPLLYCSRSAIQEYAQQHNLEWVDDESNLQSRFDRNYLRHQIIPLIRQRWPGMDATLHRSAHLCAEAAELLDEQAQLDLVAILDVDKNALQISKLRALTEVRQRNLIRYWIHRQGISLPSFKQLKEMIVAVVNSRPDAMPLVRWGAYELRRYRDHMYVQGENNSFLQDTRIQWKITEPLVLNAQSTLVATLVTGHGVAVEHISAHSVQVRFRQGGEKIKPVGRGQTCSLKNLFQENAVPPWDRQYIPLIYIDGNLAAVANLFVDVRFAAEKDQPGYDFCWKQSLIDDKL